MFLDEKKHGEAATTEPSLRHFIGWLETMPADGAYDWRDHKKCLCAQYAKHLTGSDYWGHIHDQVEANSRVRLDGIARGHPPVEDVGPHWTYGAALERAKSDDYWVMS